MSTDTMLIGLILFAHLSVGMILGAYIATRALEKSMVHVLKELEEEEKEESQQQEN